MNLKKLNWSLFFVAIVMGGLVFITGCNKKSSDVNSGSGAGSNSVMTLKGAGQ